MRPRSEKMLARYAKDFPKVNTFTVDEPFGSWTRAQREHFGDDGGLYEQVITAAKR